MTDFLSTVLENPTDAEALSVYADWLQDRGDARAVYVRGQLKLRKALIADSPIEPALQSLRSIYPNDPLPWVNWLEQAGIFSRNLCATDLASKRFSFENNQPRNDERFEVLPPFNVDRLGKHFEWLSQPPIRESNEYTRQSREDMLSWAELIDELKRQGYGFPDDFEMLMLDVALQSFLPSKTDDYFLSPENASRNLTELNDGCLYLPFYADSQWGAVYGLRLNSNVESYVPVLIGHPDYVDEESDQFAFNQHQVIGSSLETFMYQMWLENHYWFAKDSSSRGGRELTAEEIHLKEFFEN